VSDLKEILVNLVTISFTEQKRYLASVSDDESVLEGKQDDWSPKDVVAHVAHWDNQVANDLADPANRKSVDSVTNFDNVNARIWERYRDSTWSDIDKLVDRIHNDMVSNLRDLSEEELSDPERYEWMNGRPLWRSIVFTSFYHALQHVADLYAKRGDLVYANEIQESAADLQISLQDSDEWRGTVLYNLGCHYAITGQSEKALAKIGKGFNLYPDLKKWAPEDPDLANLRDQPLFATLIS
jgi:hypothetical protein